MTVVSLIKRYKPGAPGIITDRFAPPRVTELVEDAGGKWMKFNDLLILIKKGALLEMSQPLSELIDDGQSQQAFVRDVTALGYTDFDQILKVLKECREHVLVEREFEIWNIGWKDNGGGNPPVMLGKETALSFREACEKLVVTIGPKKTDQLKFDKATGKYSDYCGELVSSEAEAKAALGWK